MAKTTSGRTRKTTTRRDVKSIEVRLIASAQQAVAIKRGHAPAARTYTVARTARDVTVAAPRPYAKADVVRVREKLGLSQSVFALALGKSAPTVRSWEQGVRDPDPAANRLLEIADRHPEIILELVTAT
jgi:DNA-binding transcriptional regulator YiaG